MHDLDELLTFVLFTIVRSVLPFDRIQTNIFSSGLFGGSASGKGMHPEEDAESVHGTLEKMSAFWQDMDAPIDHMLITYALISRVLMFSHHSDHVSQI